MELHRFLIADISALKFQMDDQGEITQGGMVSAGEVPADKILDCLDGECRTEVKNTLGFYHLSGREAIAGARLENYCFGIKREKLIKKYLGALRFLPFVRGAGLAGSQAMGQQKAASDIDLLIITDPQFMWLTRTLVTAYFQIFGLRRHGLKVTNRFCLNHYLAGPKTVLEFRNLYTASEYLKLRAVVYPHGLWQFQKANWPWLQIFFPNASPQEPEKGSQPFFQRILEDMLNGQFGLGLEKILKNWQLPKIREEKFIVVKDDELSFHPDSKQQKLLESFFKFQH